MGWFDNCDTNLSYRASSYDRGDGVYVFFIDSDVFKSMHSYYKNALGVAGKLFRSNHSMMEEVFKLALLSEEGTAFLSELCVSKGIKNLDLEDIFDLSSQLALLLSSGFKPNISLSKNRKLSKRELRMILEVLNTLNIFYKSTLKAGLHKPLQTDVLKFLKSRLEECLILLSSDHGDPIVDVSANDETSLSVLKLIAQPVDLSVPKASTKRWNTALNVSRVLKEAVNPIPIAGGFLSAGFGIATLVLEKRKKKEHARNQARQLLRDASEELEFIFQYLRDLKFVLCVANDGTMTLGSVPVPLTDKVRSLESLVQDAIRLSKRFQHGSSGVLKNDLYANISNLSTRVSAYKGDLLGSIAKHFVMANANSMAQESPRKTELGPAVAASIFFALVRK